MLSCGYSDSGQRTNLALILVCACILAACKSDEKGLVTQSQVQSPVSDQVLKYPDKAPMEVPDNMVWIPGQVFSMGARPQDNMAMNHEGPPHEVGVDGFFIDIHEVTNAEFSRFVSETGYRTIAEREVVWEDFKDQLPPGTQKPADSLLQPGSLTFKKTRSSVPNLYDYSQWWNWTIGANWKHPQGPGSTIEGKDDHPVVHIALKDALAYCKWAGRRLPTEAEWELAARGHHQESVHSWGDDVAVLKDYANTWEGEFPVQNTRADGYESTAPVGSFKPNDYGLFDMAGNVWEWTSDWYHTNYFNAQKEASTTPYNPGGAPEPYNPTNPLAQEKVIKGGSYLCSASYCASYRVSARMATTIDSSLEHLGFRTVATPEMLANKSK